MMMMMNTISAITCLPPFKHHFPGTGLLNKYNNPCNYKKNIIEAKMNAKIEGIEVIKKMVESVKYGGANGSAYDTAWVGMVKNVDGSDSPQFPSTLQWIADNQLPDGSWGDDRLFLAYDRLINTLACVVALKTWNLHPEKIEKGVSFVEQNLNKLETEKNQEMTCAFETAFPSLVERAQGLGIKVPTDSPYFGKLSEKREAKLKKIPKSIMHEVPTNLLYSLEGLKGIGLNWEQLLKLRGENGSFLTSPSSTAYAFLHTKDENCLRYLTHVVDTFNGAVPNTYPVELFERLWIVDRLRRLGISRYFQPQLTEICMEYVMRHWKDEGISSSRANNVPDLDDTCMGFRLLRLYGHTVSADVFSHFKKGNEFFCYHGEVDDSVSVTYNFYRAAQLLFPGEKILEEGKRFGYRVLREKQAANELSDKWVILKDMAGEVKYALDVPWYASLPRVETRYYLEQYGGEDDVWIGKTLYRFPFVNNNTYLEVAKLDYNSCQSLHQSEWDIIQKWYREFEDGDFGVSKNTLLRSYFVATANIFEPERSKERVAWAKSVVLVETIYAYFDQEATSTDHRKAFATEFLNKLDDHYHGCAQSRAWDVTEAGKGLVRQLVATLNHMLHDQDIGQNLLDAWKDWLWKWQEEGESHAGEAELMVRTIILTSSHSSLSQEITSHPHYHQLMALTNSVCSRLRLYHKHRENGDGNYRDSVEESCMITPEIESEMQQLVQLVLDNSLNHVDPQIKTLFLTVAKSFYYTAFFPTATIDLHCAKVLFEKVD